MHSFELFLTFLKLINSPISSFPKRNFSFNKQTFLTEMEIFKYSWESLDKRLEHYISKKG